MKKIIYIFCAFMKVLFSSAPSFSGEENHLSTGQTIYIPAYSHIYFGNREKPFMLTITLSIRNIDPAHRITITEIDYFATQGQQLKRFIETAITLNPLESIRFVVPENDKGGGSGANFIVRWEADSLTNPPIMESIMIGTQSQQGISFTSQGREIFQSTK